MARRTPKGQETRERILGAALSEFARRGYATVTLEDVADAARVTKGAVYYWFADKDDLGRELQHDLYERLSHTSMRGLDLGGATVDNLARGFEIYLDALGDLGEARFFLRDAWTIPALDEAGRRDQEAAVELIRDLLARGMERGELAPLDPEALARVLLGAWNEATLHVLTTGRRDETADVVGHLIRSLRTPDQERVATP
jgi:AcrR family transcriptional regulator